MRELSANSIAGTLVSKWPGTRRSKGANATQRSPRRSRCKASSVPELASQAGDSLLCKERLTATAHRVWRSHVRPGDVVVDATCGNGFDTLELANLVLGDGSGLVVGIDKQDQAVANTRKRLEAALTTEQMERISLFQGCHSDLEAYLPAEVCKSRAVRMFCFNLGYLPGGDKSVITTHATTVEALKSAMTCLAVDGLISIMAYSGHEGGAAEENGVIDLLRELPPSEWQTTAVELLNRLSSPKLLLIRRTA
mmetsp:Transcript_5629/g.20488  ORF Transcript_5629/g.20488 Transcript_5629/m.20488 type:complete len:252 (+) Transcript_5629:32-787(+)